MAKKSLIKREHKRKKLEEKYRLIRQSLKKKSKDSFLSQRERREIQRKLQSLPRNSAPRRLHRRCLVTERPSEILDYPDTYFDKWFMHVYYRIQQNQVGKDNNLVSIFT